MIVVMIGKINPFLSKFMWELWLCKNALYLLFEKKYLWKCSRNVIIFKVVLPFYSIFFILFQSSDDPDIYGSSAEDPTLLLSSGIANDANIKKGLLWQQKDKIFSRWKERFFILTKDYFHCFKKGNTRLTEMGGFIFKVILQLTKDYEKLYYFL